MMVSNPDLDLMYGRLPKFDDLFAIENLVETLDFDFMVNGINSIPLHKRLNIKQELLSEAELDIIETDACNFLKCFKEKLEVKGGMSDFSACKVLLDPQGTENDFTGKKNLKMTNETVSTVNEKIEEDSGETFLNYVYDLKGNSLLIPTLQRNINFNCLPTCEITQPTNQRQSNLADFETFLFDISTGMYDHLARSRNTPTYSSSSSESEEEVGLRTRHLTSRLKFMPNDTNKFTFLKKITDDSLKINNRDAIEKEKTHFHPVNWLTSDEDSENDVTDRRTQVETKRRPKRSQKIEGEKQKNKQSCSSQIPSFKNNQSRRKLNKSHGNSSRTQECTPNDFQSTSQPMEAAASNTPEGCTINPNESINQNLARGKRHQKVKKNTHNVGLTAKNSYELNKSFQTELQTLPAKDSRPDPVEEIGTSQLLDDGTSSSKKVETKIQKQIANEKKSSNSTASCCKSAEDVVNDPNQSTDSSGEDWLSLSQKNLSGFDKLLQHSSKS